MTEVSLARPHGPRTGPASLTARPSLTLAEEHVLVLQQVTTSAEKLLTAAEHGRWPLASGADTVRMDSGAAGELADEAAGVPTIFSSHLDVTARVPRLDPAGFDAVIGEASELCPVSRLFAGAKVTIEATLEPAS
jgi:hypothetical protein